ncbi:MAG: GNAT family N-acetyltransferase [Steroidobacteraceae bacterium]
MTATPGARDAGLTLRRLGSADLPACLALTQAVNWSHRLEDWAFHLRLGRGFGIDDERGELVGTIIWWAYGAELGALGLVVVRGDCQGRGLGRRLMDAVLAEAGARAMQLVATQAGIKLYRDCGFVVTGDIEQVQGTIGTVPVAARHGLVLRPVAAADLATLRELDARALGAPRHELIDAVLQEGGAGTLALRAGVPAGFALQRAAGRGMLVGPVIADDEATAIALVGERLRAIQGFTRLDVPGDAAALRAFLADAGLAGVDRVTAMRRGTAPPADPQLRRWGLVSQAFG